MSQLTMTKKAAAPRDFVDYFFQKDGDTYIAQLIKLRDDYEQQCTDILAKSETFTRKDFNDYHEFKSKLLDMEKIAPTIASAQTFAFEAALASVFQNLDIDVTDALDMIGKYCSFMETLHNHWKGLELESCAVIDTTVQLMATLESIVYPLFLKLTEYIAKLAANPANATEADAPEMMVSRLHKLSEALVMEIAGIGSSGVTTIGGQVPETTRESLQLESAILGRQGKNAKNCVAWAANAVAPSLLFYYLKYKEQGAGVPICTCGGLGPVQKKPKEKPEIEEISKIERVYEEDVEKPTKDAESNETVKGSTSGTSTIKEVKESRTRMREESGSDEEQDADEEKDAKSEQEQEETVRVIRIPAPQPEEAKDTEDFQLATGHGEIKNGEQDFVSYFFKKNGVKYVAILAQTKKKYEERCKQMLITDATHDQKLLAKEFVSLVHDVRKVSPVTRAVEVGDFNFPEDLETVTQDFDIKVQDKIALLRKDYTRGMFRHWDYRIENDQLLTPETVVDVATQMMATTMALTYPIFIRLGEFLRTLSITAENNRDKYTPDGLAAKLHDLVEVNALQVAAIGISALNIIAKMNTTTKEVLADKREALAGQTTLAKNSVSWAMKAISPLLLLYFLRANLQFPTIPGDGKTAGKPRPRTAPMDTEVEREPPHKTRSAEVRGEPAPKKHHEHHEHHDHPPAMAEEEHEQSATPYQETLHGAQKYYKKPSEENNFVHYFYAKQGQHYSTILTHMRKQYEEMVQTTMEQSTQQVKDNAVNFVQKFHNARKPSIPHEDLLISDIKFEEAITKIFHGLDIHIHTNIKTLVKYFEFTKNMEEHWQYRIKKNLELDQDAILEVSIEMMGTTVALSYPIFIKMAEYVADILRTSGQTNAKLSPKNLVERLTRFVSLLTTEMAAIGMSCTATMAKVPRATKDSVSSHTSRLVNETKIADSSVSWAMKAIFPVFMMYFIQYESATYR